MIDLFRQLKLEYKDYVILFKSGNFYISFDEDAVILNNVFGFKLNELKNNIKVGFPLSSVDKYTSTLNKLNINYLIIENKEIVIESKFESNKFNDYSISVFNIISINNKLNKINEFIKSINDFEIQKEIINKIENILNSYK